MADFSVPIVPGVFPHPPDIANAKGTDLSFIGNLPDAYWAGQQQAFRQRNQDLFQGGNLPRDASGNIDWNKASQMALAAGGREAIPEAVSVGNLQGGQAVLDANRNLDRGFPSQSASGPPSSAEPTQSPVAQGTATLRQIAQARSLDLNQLMSQTRLDPDAPLTFEQRQAIAPILRGQSAPAEEPQQTAGPATFDQRFPQIAAAGPGAMAIRPNVQPPQGQPAPIQQAQAQVAPGARPPALPAQVQQMRQEMQDTETLARVKANLATAAGQFGRTNEQKALTDEADQLHKTALAIRQSIMNMMQPTEAEKNANNPEVAAAERRKHIQDLKDAAAEKVYGGIRAAASQYERDLKPYTDLGTAILSDPRTYTGAGANAVLDINKVRAIFGDGKAAMMQEAVQKLNAASVLSQINTQKDQMQEAGSNSSRLFSSQVEQVEKASANMGNTIQGNRFLLNVQQHMGEASLEVARQARDYRAKHGVLDDGFDNQITSYLQKHPVFTDLERSRPDILSAPTVPPGAQNWSKEQAAAWGRDHGLKPGDAARVSNGVYLTIPRIDVYRAR